MSRLRAMVVLGTSERGGAERQALILAEHLAQDHGLAVTVAAPGRDGAVVEQCAATGLPFHPLPLFESRRPAVCLARMLCAALSLRRMRPDLLLPYTWTANVLCGLFRPVTGARWTLWNQRDEGLGRLVPSLERRAAAGCTAFATNSPGGAAFLGDALGITAGRIQLTHNALAPLDAGATRGDWRKCLGLADGQSAAIMVANLQRHKDQATLLAAWALLPMPRPVLVLAGRLDDTAESLRAQAVRLGIADDVRWPGAVDDLGGLIGACDLGLFSSSSEGCPNGLLEAMAAGLPCIASDISGVRFASGDDGVLLVPARDASAFAAAVQRVLSDTTIARRLAERARLACSAFSPQLALAEACAAVSAATHGQWRPA